MFDTSDVHGVYNALGSRFFKALACAAKKILGDEHSCTRAADKAATMEVPEMSHDHIVHVQEEVNQLDDDQRDRLLKEAHQSLVTDPSAILQQWQPNEKNSVH